VIDVFIINVAIPSIRKGVHATDAETQLVIAAYLLGYAVFLITGGRAGDLCGLSTTASMLCVARLFQCVTAAFMVPQTISYIQILFPGAAERAKAVGLFGVTLGLASIIGQSMGGGCRTDYVGVLLLTVAMVALIYPIIQGRESGWPLWSIAAIAGSVFLFRGFFIHQSRKLERGGDPLIHTHLFIYRDFNLSLAAVLFYFMAHSSYLLTSTVYFQEDWECGVSLRVSSLFSWGQAL